MPKTALVLIIAGCALPIWFYLGDYPWSPTTKMGAVALGAAMAFTGLAILVGKE